MYKPGYFPTKMTPLSGLKVYRNNAKGIYIHRCQNIRVDQGLFADNYIGIDLDRTEGVEVTNTTVIGRSVSYETLQRRQTTGVAPICDANQRVGIDLHTWQVETDYYGGRISNVSLSGFVANDTRCSKPRSIRFDSFVRLQIRSMFRLYAFVQYNQLTTTSFHPFHWYRI
jgi:hypothetical protein